jgi:putative endonuclease
MPTLKEDPAKRGARSCRPVSSWYLYILECERGRLYTGISPDVERRFRRHVAGRGGTFTRLNPPRRIIAAAEFPNRAAATRAEIALKKLPRQQKLRWAGANAWRPAGAFSPGDPPAELTAAPSGEETRTSRSS